jgi:hypothetical protein
MPKVGEVWISLTSNTIVQVVKDNHSSYECIVLKISNTRYTKVGQNWCMSKEFVLDGKYKYIPVYKSPLYNAIIGEDDEH